MKLDKVTFKVGEEIWNIGCHRVTAISGEQSYLFSKWGGNEDLYASPLLIMEYQLKRANSDRGDYKRNCPGLKDAEERIVFWTAQLAGEGTIVYEEVK